MESGRTAMRKAKMSELLLRHYDARSDSVYPVKAESKIVDCQNKQDKYCRNLTKEHKRPRE